MDKRSSAVLSALAAPILSGFIRYFSNILTGNGITPVNVSFLRDFVCVVPLAIIILTVNVNIFRFKLKDLWLFLLMGALRGRIKWNIVQEILNKILVHNLYKRIRRECGGD